MPRNGSGTFAKAVSDFVNNTTISESDMNTLIDDIGDEITNSIAKDGQTPWTGTDDHNGNKIVLDADGDTSIHADTDDQVDFEVGGTDMVRFTTGGVVLASTSKIHRTVTTGITAGTTQTQGGATALTTEFNIIGTCANTGDGVKLPTAVAGLEITIYNGGAQPAQVWPATSDKINGGSADAVDAQILRPGDTATYIAKDATDWYRKKNETMDYISEVSASGAASVEFTGLSDDYDLYIIDMANVLPASSSPGLQMRTSANNGSSYDAGASDYSWNYVAYGAAGGAISTYDSADSEIQLSHATEGSTSKGGLNGRLLIHRPSATTYTHVTFTWSCSGNGDEVYTGVTGGSRIAAAAVNAVQFLFPSINISGEFRLYGVRKT